jgi:TonB family protein
VIKAQTAERDHFVIARRTFFDSGPPFEFYELISVQSQGNGATIERITLTPETDLCTRATTLEQGTASISASVADLLGRTNPCTIPEKELRRELKRCKRCLVFSGADVAMQVQCGEQTRRIRMDVLDRDMFDPAPKTPEHTSWTMTLLGRLDRALGNNVMDRPAFSLTSPADPPVTNVSVDALVGAVARGEFDGLFEKGGHKLSELLHEAQRGARWRGRSVALTASHPFTPASYDLPNYPPIAVAARVGGEVVVTIEVDVNGGVVNQKIVSGHRLLQGAVLSVVGGWKFPMEASGQEIRSTVEFKMDCAPGKR